MAARRRPDPDTSSQVLDVAEQLVQERGYNGFSYADIAAAMHISKAALHYHFPGKADLGVALIARYASQFAGALAAADTAADTAADAGAASASGRLARYADLYLQVLRDRRMCLCGMLAAEYQTLPGPMQDAVISFFDENESWLERVLEQGRSDGSLQFAGSARDTARMIVGSLEGAMLVARPYGDIARFQAAAANLLAGLARAPGEPVQQAQSQADALPA
jgi:TetR/AcrR family transcriptional regulator, transcriptional repressor for nem operon